MPPSYKLVTRPIAQIPLTAGETVVDVCARDTIAALVLKSPPDFRHTHANGVSTFKRHADQPNHFEIRLLDAEGAWRCIPLPPNRENWGDLRPLPGGRWLLFRGRAVGPADRNAFILGPDGRELGRFHIGDGVQHVDLLGNGPVWVAYFDEAWGSAQEPSTCGLAAIDIEGAVGFCFNRPAARENLDDIFDAYAMNVVSADEAWVYYYTEFHLVQIKHSGNGFEIAETHKQLKVRGAQVIAVTDDYVLLLGSYFDPHEAWLLSRKTGRRARVRIVDPKGRRAVMSDGRAAGPLVYAVENGVIWRMDLRDLR